MSVVIEPYMTLGIQLGSGVCKASYSITSRCLWQVFYKYCNLEAYLHFHWTVWLHSPNSKVSSGITTVYNSYGIHKVKKCKFSVDSQDFAIILTIEDALMDKSLRIWQRTRWETREMKEARMALYWNRWTLCLGKSYRRRYTYYHGFPNCFPLHRVLTVFLRNKKSNRIFILISLRLSNTSPFCLNSLMLISMTAPANFYFCFCCMQFCPIRNNHPFLTLI